MTSKPNNVYFFGTCLIDIMYPQAGVSAVQLLQRAGVKVIFPPSQTCCGQPAFNSGYREQARDVARAQVALFPKPIPIVVPSGSCAGMMKHHYPELFKGEADEAQAIDVANRVYELTEFLVDVLQIELHDLGEPVKVAVHTSCSARREMGVADKIESLLGQLAQVERVEHARKPECCGFGGTFAVKEPEISAAMVLDKVSHIRDTGADKLISQDCGCLMNISGAMGKQGNAIPSQHIAEFLWERITPLPNLPPQGGKEQDAHSSLPSPPAGEGLGMGDKFGGSSL